MNGASVESVPSDIWQWLVQTFAQAGHALAGFFHHVGASISHALGSFFHNVGASISHGFRSLGLDRLLNAVVVLAHAIVIGLAFLLALAMIVMSVTFLLMITATLISYARRQARQRASVRIRLSMASTSPDEPLWGPQRPVLPFAHQHPPHIPQFTAGRLAAHSQSMRAVQELHNETERRRRATNRMEQIYPRWARSAFVSTFLSLHEKAYGDPDDCIICFDALSDANKRIGKLPCGHVFHWDCIEQWFLSWNESSCPVCRKVYPENMGPSSYGTI